MFYDKVKIKVKAGDGGNGLTSFRRERYVAHGGPDGGDGGCGGSIYFSTDLNLNTLSPLIRFKKIEAPFGGNGGKNKMRGKNGRDLIINVPLGTIVYDAQSEKIIADLYQENQKIKIADGGRGGFGNAHFTSSQKQAPKISELGEPGEEKELICELRLVADIGIIGIPSSGKSTLLSVVSEAKPKIANYPFTTLIPNLGVIKMAKFGLGDKEFIACDIPGLIKDAYKGKGLGDAFLRHIQRCRIIIHLLDITRNDLVSDYKDIRKELELFDAKLARKKEIVAINKVDIIDSKQLTANSKQIIKELRKITKNQVFFISAVTHEGVKELLAGAAESLRNLPKVKFEPKQIKVFRPQEKLMKNFVVEKVRRNSFIVKGKRIEQLASQTDISNDEALARLEKATRSAEVTERLKEAGAVSGNQVKIGRREARIDGDRLVFIK